jgi:competence protein ComEC
VKRPALVATLWLMCGIVLGGIVLLPGWVVLVSLVALIASYAVLPVRQTGLLSRRRGVMGVPPSGYLLLGAFALIGIFLQNQIVRENRLAGAIAASIPSDQRVVIKGRLVLLPDERTGHIMLTVRRCTLQLPDRDIEFPARVLVTATGEAAKKVLSFAPVNGDLITAAGNLLPPPQLRNPDVFNYEAYLGNKGVFAIMRCRNTADIELAPPGLHGAGLRGRAPWNTVLLATQLFRKKCEALFDTVMSRDSSEMLKSIFLGEAHYLQPGERRAFLRTGLMHIFAVSGLNFGMVVVLFYALFRVMGFSLRANVILTLLGIALYGAMVEFRPSVMRAGIMATCLLLSFIMRREIEPISALAFAAFLVLLFNPRALWQADFQLSYACVASIILFKPVLEETLYFHLQEYPLGSRKKLQLINHYILDPLHLLLAVQIGIIPLTVNYFHYISFVAPLAQLVIVPLTFFIMALGFLISIFGNAVYFVAVVFGKVAELLIIVMRALTGFFASFSVSATNVQSIPFYGIALYYFALLAGAHIIASKSLSLSAAPVAEGALLKRRTSFLVSVAVIVAILVWLPIVHSRRDLYVCFLDVGQGDSAYVEFPTGENLLVDGGSGYPHDQGRYVVVPFLQARGINRLTALIMSHPDADHIGGLPFVLESVWVDEAIEGSSTSPARLYQRLQQLIADLEVKHIRVQRGDCITGIPDATLTVLHPPPISQLVNFPTRQRPNLNNQSLVARLSYGGVSFLFTGDAEREAEDEMTRISPARTGGSGQGRAGMTLASTVLKVAHHGSKNSSTPGFLEAVQPRVAVISVGANNPYGHPSPGTLQRLEAIGARIYRTDLDGAIQMRTDGARLFVRPTILAVGEDTGSH